MKSFNNKSEALFRDIKPMEFILICLPFLLFIFSNQKTIYLLEEYEAQHVYLLVLYGFIFIIILGVLFFIGAKWRILYFGIILLFAIFLLFFLGKPEEYYEFCDRDDAIRVGIKAILKFDYPYYNNTNLGNPITPLPFTFFFYLPVYLLTGGYIFYMNIIVIITFCIVLFYNFMDTEKDFLILPIISFIIFSDWFFLEIIINSDIMNSILILCMILFLIPNEIPEQRKVLKYLSLIPEKPNKINKKTILFAILFGCLLAMRIYFWLIGVIIFLYVFRIYGLKNIILLSTLTLTVFLIWILPFFLYNPDYFVEEVLMGGNSFKFSTWRSYRKVHPKGYFILDFLNEYLDFKEENAIYISCFIIFCSILLGLIELKNKFHLLFIISFCYIILLFFMFHGTSYSYVRDYISLAAIPFIISILYSEQKPKESTLSIIE